MRKRFSSRLGRRILCGLTAGEQCRHGSQRLPWTMFEKLIELIDNHARYGPAMARAVEAKDSLVLNYHTHGPDQDYCVSIAAKQFDPIQFFENKKTSSLEELVHVRGFGKTEEQCVPMCTSLGHELVQHYGLEETPEIYLNGQPFEEEGWDGAR